MPGMPDANVQLLGAPEIAGLLHAPDSAASGVIEMQDAGRTPEAPASETAPEQIPASEAEFTSEPAPVPLPESASEPVAAAASAPEAKIEATPEPPRLATAKTEIIDVDQAKKEAAGTKRGWWRRPAE